MNWAIVFDYAAWMFWGLVAMGGGFWFTLKAWDKIQAIIYDRRKRNAKPEAVCACPSCSPHLYAEMPAVVIISRSTRITSDRPEDGHTQMVRDDIEEIIKELEGGV